MDDIGLAKMDVASVPRLALRPAEAARALGLSERTLWTLADAGTVPSVRVGKLRLFPVAVLQRWLIAQAGQAGKENAKSGENVLAMPQGRE